LSIRKGIKLGIGASIGITITLLAIIIGFAVIGGFVKIPGGILQPSTSEQQQGYSLSLPLKVSIQDPLAASAVDGTVYILDENNVILESFSTSSGVGTSSNVYKSGTKLKIFVAASGYFSKMMEYTVPLAERTEQDYYYVTVNAYDAPSDTEFTMSIMSETGSQLVDESTAATYDMSGTEEDFYLHMTLAEDVALINFFDPTEGSNGEDDDVLIVLKANDTRVTIEITGYDVQRLEYGDNVYYVFKLPDWIGDRSETTVLSIAFTLYYGGTEAITLQAFLYTNTDLDIFASSLSADSDAVLTDNTAVLTIT